MSQQVEEKQAGRRLGGGAIASLSGLAVLLIFVIQNREHIKIHFLFWPLWLYTIVMAAFGALVVPLSASLLLAWISRAGNWSTIGASFPAALTRDDWFPPR